ncbi:hypothetical protein AB0L10_19020 [Streptomyces flaveolus]|uniref:hypothetical protein n=1 Tax=Streptomyces flaveolus TaxID=67297 RepID=UPI003415E02E
MCRRLRKPTGGHAGDHDTGVPIGNARTCARTLAQRRARVRVLEVGPVDHCGPDRAASAGIARWFSGGAAR